MNYIVHLAGKEVETVTDDPLSTLLMVLNTDDITIRLADIRPVVVDGAVIMLSCWRVFDHRRNILASIDTKCEGKA